MFGVSRQAVYQSQQRQLRREAQLQIVKNLVLSIRKHMPRIGTRKLYYLLKEDLLVHQIKIGRDALFKLLRREHLLIRPKRNYTKTTHSKHWLHKHPNRLLGRSIDQPEQVFVSDITYVKSKQATHYLSLVTDACSRKIMGYKLSDDLGARHMVDALKMTLKNRQGSAKFIHHSDRGLQYCSQEFQEVLQANQGVASMTQGYDCYQNALAERMNGILKGEFLIYQCNTKVELKKLIEQSINTYNELRPHWALNFKTPNFVHEKLLGG